MKEAVRSNVPEAKFGLLSRVPAWDIDVEVCIDEGVDRTVWIYYNLQPIKKGKILESFFSSNNLFVTRKKLFLTLTIPRSAIFGRKNFDWL